MNLWRPYPFQVSAINELLDRPNLTVEQLFDEEDILEELKGQNRKLIDFLTRTESLKVLIDFVSKPPKDACDYKSRIKYPSLAAEVLCSDIWLISEAIYENEQLLESLYSFLDESPLNPLLCLYSGRVALTLLQKKPTETFDFYKKKNVFDKIMKNIRNSSVIDLLLKIINCEETVEVRSNGVLEILSSKNLIMKLITIFQNAEDSEVHEVLAQALSEIVIISSNTSPLLLQLQSRELLSDIFLYLLNVNSSSAYLNGMSVLIEIIKRCQKSDGVPEPITVSIENLPQMIDILKNSNAPSMMTSTGELKPPFGFRRMKTLDFLLGLVETGYRAVEDALLEHDFFQIVFDLFFQYPWNNFLHSSVEHLIEVVLDGSNEDLKLQLFTKYKLADRMIDANEENEKEKRGFMGHLINISVMADKSAERNASLSTFLTGKQEWKDYLLGPVADVLRSQRRLLSTRDPVVDEYGYDEYNNQDEQNESNYATSSFVNDFPDEFDYEESLEEEEELDFEPQKTFDGAFSTDEKKFSQEIDELDDDSVSSSDEEGVEDDDPFEFLPNRSLVPQPI
eukprot:TRINITY_DN12178_c0_g1_i1.p1 TRINITY_DN12178_c0_g1~~TRINITY_DN12178_c0_g1_i1.p1  ORF type:complete len:566 (-),score=148.38 TRINITY_DN12178_c0_g1_i1:140-1837(-)